MDLESYLEQNIIDFLEKKEAEKEIKATQIRKEQESFRMKKDYLGILRSAISTENFEKAKEIFDEADNEFAKAKTDIERKQYTEMMDTMFLMIRKHDSLKKEIKRMIEKKEREHEEQKQKEAIKTEEKPVSLSKMQPKGVVMTEVPAEEPMNKDDVQKLVVAVKKDLENSNIKISQYLETNNFNAAMDEYKQMKKRFDQVPDYAEEKKNLFEDLISCYNQIKKLEHLVTKEITDEIKKNKEKRKKLFEETKEKVLLTSKKIKVFLQNTQYRNAMLEYNEIKELFDSYPLEYKTERSVFYKQLIHVYEEIKKIIEENYHKKIFKEKKPLKTLKKEDNPEIKRGREIFHVMIKLKEEIKEIIYLMKESEIDKAKLKLIEIKHEIEMLPDDKKEEKNKFEHIIEEIGHRMNFLEHTTEMLKQNA